MKRILFYIMILAGFGFAISFSAQQKGSSPADQADMAITENIPSMAAIPACNALHFGLKVPVCNISGDLNSLALATPAFSVTELRHYLCALEVKKRNSQEIIIQESAQVCTKTIPEYLAEPTCK